MDSNTSNSNNEVVVAVTTKTKILAYLGELKKNEWVLATKLCLHLNLRYTTAKNTLAMLEHQGLVAKEISKERGTVALYCIPVDTSVKLWENSRWVHKPFIPPEWSAAYGQHPHAV